MTVLGNLLVVSLLTVLPVAAESMPVSFSPASYVAGELPVDPNAGSSAPFNVPDSIQVPGKTLSAGDYTIRIVDHLSDRMIIRVERKGKPQATFLALPKSTLNSTTGQGPIRLNGASKTAMRGFVFPDGTVAEFVYPKAEAVGLAKANSTTIPAVDPASEGRPDTRNLSQDDMQMVTLWMLSPTLVKPGESGPGIAAAKYKEPAPVEVASAQTPPAPVRVKPRPKPVMAALPHTAGEMPVVELAGLVSLCAAGWLTRRRLVR